jgi:pimeloyl-ACP methyl ester carboxylesterase
VPWFSYQGQRIEYAEFGGGPAAVSASGERAASAPSAAAWARPLILVHGLLLSGQMHHPLARDLAARGNRVITIDLLGHGGSDRPVEMWRYSMGHFAHQTLALMDHLELEQAAVMGTSLGANTALEMGAAAPQRLRAMVIEMPVLDNALLACAIAFSPLLVALTLGERVMELLARGARAVPRGVLPFWGNVALDTLRQEPAPSAAVLQGLFFGRIAPGPAERRTLQTPALVIGHHRDPVHPFSDAGMLVSEMPHARLLEASSLLELRFRPERLTGEIADFLDMAWSTSPRRGTARRSPARGAARGGVAADSTPRQRRAGSGPSASSR